MNPKIIVRPEQPGDERDIFEVVAEAFPTDDEARLVNLIRDRGESLISIVATIQNEIIGHVLISPIQISSQRLAVGGLAPLSVKPAHQQQGAGGLLMSSAISASRDIDLVALFLLGDPAYYQRFGFSPSHLNNEYGATDGFMHLELTPGALDDVSGTARYVTAFSDIGA